MKKGYTYILVALLMLLALAGCVNKEEDYEPNFSIFFNAVVGNRTKANYTDVVYPNDVPFRVWGYKLINNKNWNSNRSDADVVFDDLQVKYLNGFWYTVQQHIWPSDEYRMNFFAFSPSDCNATFSRENGVELKNFDAAKDCGFLYTEPVTDMISPEIDAPVQLVFKSPMSEVLFKVYAVSSNDINLNITGVKLKDVYTKGNFMQYSTPHWYDLSEKKDVVVFEGDNSLKDTPEYVGESIYLIPQDIKPVIFYNYKVDGTLVPIYREVELDMSDLPNPSTGRKQVYTIKISPETVLVQNPKN